MIIRIEAATFRQMKSLYLMVQRCDSGNIQEIFAADSKIAVCDPVYPVYVDTNVMAGRTGTYDPKTETWSNVIYMPCTKENELCTGIAEGDTGYHLSVFPE